MWKSLKELSDTSFIFPVNYVNFFGFTNLEEIPKLDGVFDILLLYFAEYLDHIAVRAMVYEMTTTNTMRL